MTNTLHSPLYDELRTENFPLYVDARGTHLSPTIMQYTITLRGMKHRDCARAASYSLNQLCFVSSNTYYFPYTGEKNMVKSTGRSPVANFTLA